MILDNHFEYPMSHSYHLKIDGGNFSYTFSTSETMYEKKEG